MKKFLFIVISSLIICSTASAKKNFSRGYFFALIEDKGSTGFVLRYHNEKNLNKFEIILPKNSPPIISDYHSRYGVLGGSRSKPRKHGGVDFYQVPGEKILAAADGKVYGVKKKDKCVGNQFAIYFGKSPDGTSLYASHMHVGKIYVKKGDLVLDCGTSHYIFNVKNLFQNVFNITKIGGCIYHSIGSNGYYDQAFYQFSPTLLIKVYKNLEILFSCQIFPKNQRLVKNYFHNSYYYNSPNKSKTLIAFFILKVENSKLNLNPQFEYNYLTNSKNKEGLNLTENEVLYDKRSFNKKIRNLVYENINNILEKIHFI